MALPQEKVTKLLEPIPKWAVKPHPTRSNMTAIHPMAIIDRLNEVFGFGAWQWNTHIIDCTKEIQQTKSGDRQIYVSSVHGALRIPAYDIHIEQFGGSTNDDKGDALKGGSTDALTKCASYLGIGASIYKGQGNEAPVAPTMTPEDAITALSAATTIPALLAAWEPLSPTLKKDPEIVAMKDEMKAKLSN